MKPRFKPLKITHGHAEVTIYRQKSETAADGFIYVPTWRKSEGGRGKSYHADLGAARDAAKMKAQQLAAGLSESEHATRADLQELATLRIIARKQSVPTVAAMEEWAAARILAGGAIIEACTAWAQDRKPKELPRIQLEDAIKQFIASKERAHGEGQRTYGSKLNSLLKQAGNVFVDTITVKQFTKWLETFADAVTRNDHRKRAVTLFRWLQRQGYFSDDVKLAVEKTDRARESASEIGIISPKIFQAVLEFLSEEHPHYLAAAVLSGLMGMRADEVHGKRSKKGVPRETMQRQTWEDISLENRHLTVTVAKKGTPSWRLVPIPLAAHEWLLLCKDRTGPVCSAGALLRVRALCTEVKKMDLPENCFRHSYISHRIAFNKDKASCATDCGTSVKEIDRRYRRPILPEIGKQWFHVRPPGAPAKPAIPPAEFELLAHALTPGPTAASRS